MSDKIAKIIGAYMQLPPAEKRQLAEVVSKLQRAGGPLSERQLIKNFGLESFENATTINFAPVPSNCPTCGK